MSPGTLNNFSLSIYTISLPHNAAAVTEDYGFMSPNYQNNKCYIFQFRFKKKNQHKTYIIRQDALQRTITIKSGSNIYLTDFYLGHQFFFLKDQ